jgi:hypothetical protein
MEKDQFLMTGGLVLMTLGAYANIRDLKDEVRQLKPAVQIEYKQNDIDSLSNKILYQYIVLDGLKYYSTHDGKKLE